MRLFVWRKWWEPGGDDALAPGEGDVGFVEDYVGICGSGHYGLGSVSRCRGRCRC